VGPLLGSGVGPLLGVFVGTLLGVPVGTLLGAPVGALLGMPVGALLGFTPVGFEDGENDGPAVGSEQIGVIRMLSNPALFPPVSKKLTWKPSVKRPDKNHVFGMMSCTLCT
jgi:hypothetical protein